MTPVTVLASKSEDTTEELERAPAFGKRTARYYKVVLKNVYDKLDEFIPNNARDAELDSLLKNVRETMDLLFNDAKSFYEQNMEWVLTLRLRSTSDYYCRKLNLPTSGFANAPAPTEVLDPVKAKLFENQLSYIDGLEAAWHDYRLSPSDPQFGARDELYHNLKDRIADIDAKLDKLVPVAELDEKVATITAFAKMDLLKMRSAVAKDGKAHSKETDSKLDFSNSDKLFDIAAIYQYKKVENWLSLSRQARRMPAKREKQRSKRRPNLWTISVQKQCRIRSRKRERTPCSRVLRSLYP